jgi:hypothetical protein
VSLLYSKLVACLKFIFVAPRPIGLRNMTDRFGLNNIVTVYLVCIAFACYLPLVLKMKIDDDVSWNDNSSDLHSVSTANYALLTLSLYMLYDAVSDIYCLQLPSSYALTRFLMIIGIVGSSSVYVVLTYQNEGVETNMVALICTHYFRTICIFIPFMSHIIGFHTHAETRVAYAIEILLVGLFTTCICVFLLHPFIYISDDILILTAACLGIWILFLMVYTVHKIRQITDVNESKKARIFVVSSCLGAGLFLIIQSLISITFGSQSWGNTTSPEHIAYFVLDMITISFIHTLPTKSAQMDYASYKV